jgi:S-formylglutathione hydrolase FrmB
MPSDGLRGDGTAYMRHGDGSDYERWIIDEVPAAAVAALPDLDPAAPLCLAGLSMGGFGALRIGARHAARVAAVSAHSSMTHFSQMAQFVEEDPTGFGTAAAEASVLDTIIEAGVQLPPLRFDCGLDDGLLEHNRDLHRALRSRGIAHIYEEFPGGHTWAYWEQHLDDTLRFFGKVLGR